MALQFKVDSTIFSFPEDTIPQGTFLDAMAHSSMHVKRENGTIVLTGISLLHFEQVHAYLVQGVVPDIKVWSTLDYLGLNPLEYACSWQQEEHMRKSMYDPKYKTHAMNTNLHYNLVKLTPELWEALELQYPDDPTMIRCSNKILQKQDWSEVQANLAELKQIIPSNTCVAGGRVFSALFGTSSNDVDLFFYGVNAEEAYTRIQECITESKKSIEHHSVDELSPQIRASFEQLQRKMSYSTTIMRTKNALSFDWNEQEIQFILRLYRTPSEILHGFDVDACAVGYDGEHIWMTQRCLSALTHGYNTFSFDRLSPSYEWRLVKYSTRGLPVKVPGLTSDHFDHDAMQARWQHHLNCTDLSTHPDRRYKEIKGRELYSRFDTEEHPRNLQGVDILVYMQFHCQQYNYRERMLKTVSKLSKESSDYSPIPFSQSKNQSCQQISWILEYLLDDVSKRDYPEKFAEYAPYLSEYDGSYRVCEFSLNNIPVAPKIYLVTCFNSFNPLNDLKVICNLPEALYTGLGIVRPWDLPRQLEFKTCNPGEQMTGSFHQTILEDTAQWYCGHYYHS